MTARSPIQIIREQQARRDALRSYARAHDHFATEEQTFAGEGKPIEAAGAHEYALIALRAYRAELDDPPVFPMDPREGQWG